MQKSQIRDFTQGSITRQLIPFALPLFLSNLLQVVYNMVDMIVVGHVLGKAGTSAVAVGGVIYYIVYQTIIFAGLDTNYLKMFSALLVAIFLAIPFWKTKYFAMMHKSGSVKAAARG